MAKIINFNDETVARLGFNLGALANKAVSVGTFLGSDGDKIPVWELDVTIEKVFQQLTQHITVERFLLEGKFLTGANISVPLRDKRKSPKNHRIGTEQSANILHLILTKRYSALGLMY